jgi:hypothetical protein
MRLYATLLKAIESVESALLGLTTRLTEAALS